MNYSVLYYPLASPLSAVISKLETLKDPSGLHPVQDQNLRRRDGVEELRLHAGELNTISYDDSSEQGVEYTKITIVS